MTNAEAIRALDMATERVVSFGMSHNFRNSGKFFIYGHELAQEAVDKAQVDERRRNPDQPLVASRGMKPGTHVALIESKDLGLLDRTVWMSTHEAEKTTQAEFVAKARGRVLIAGFGLGMVTEAVLSKSEVTAVTVVEKNPEVTNIMSPWIDDLEHRHRAKRFNIAYADIFTYKPASRFDSIYFDIWPTITPKNMVGMIRLRRRYRRSLKPGGWMGCWAEAECRDQLQRLEKKSPMAARALKAVDAVYGDDGVVLRMCQIDEGADL